MKKFYILSKEWSRHGKASGYQRLTGYLSIPFKYPKNIRLPHKISKCFKVKTKIVNYQSNTLYKELSLLFKIFTSKTIHVLYGDMDFYYLHYLKMFPFNLRKNELIVTFHHPPKELEKRLNYNKDRVLGSIDKIIVMGRNQITFFEKYTNAQIKFIPHGINLQHFKIDNSIPRLNQILLVGTTHRDHERNIKVINKINKLVNVNFKIVMFEEHTLPYRDISNVELITNNISDQELLYLYQSSKALLMSLKDCTASNAILEAMACGCPLVINNVGAVKDYLIPESTISIFETEDIEGTVDYMCKLIRDEVFLSQVVDKQSKLVEKYKWENVIKQTEQFILNGK